MSIPDRSSMFRDKKVSYLLNKFISGVINEIAPTLDPLLGPRYAVIEDLLGIDGGEEAYEFLEQLADAQILTRKFYEKVLLCPRCHSFHIIPRFRCVYCGSRNIDKSALIEHKTCGYLGEEEAFIHGEKLICPNCGAELSKQGEDFRRLGIWYYCKECKRRFDHPKEVFLCPSCSYEFTLENALWRDAYAYTLNPDVYDEFAQFSLNLTPIERALKRVGFSVEFFGSITGRSGVVHEFTIVGRRENQQVLVLDIETSPSGEVSIEEIVKFVAKIVDTTPNISVLIAMPSVSDFARRFAKEQKIVLIEAKSVEEASQKLWVNLLASYG